MGQGQPSARGGWLKWAGAMQTVGTNHQQACRHMVLHAHQRTPPFHMLLHATQPAPRLRLPAAHRWPSRQSRSPRGRSGTAAAHGHRTQPSAGSRQTAARRRFLQPGSREQAGQRQRAVRQWGGSRQGEKAQGWRSCPAVHHACSMQHACAAPIHPLSLLRLPSPTETTIRPCYGPHALMTSLHHHLQQPLRITLTCELLHHRRRLSAQLRHWYLLMVLPEVHLPALACLAHLGRDG